MMDSNTRAIKHYSRWTRARFPKARLYVFVTIAVTASSFVTWWLVAKEIGEKFDWVAWLKLSILFSVFSFIIIFFVRWAAISASWIVAKQALDLIRIGERAKAWALLSARYSGIHPLVINEPAFREILAAATQDSTDSSAREMFSAGTEDISRSHEPRAASSRVDLKAKRAAIFIIVCFVLMVVVGAARFLLR